MPDSEDRTLSHLILQNVTSSERFRLPNIGGSQQSPPERDRATHGVSLRAQVSALRPVMQATSVEQGRAGIETKQGIYVEFESFPDIELAFQSLDRVKEGIELLNVQRQDDVTRATVFVPNGKLRNLERLIVDYLEEKRDSSGRLRDNKKLLNTIQQIRAGVLRDLWTDDPAEFPDLDDAIIWWETWLSVRGNRRATIEDFRKLAAAQEIYVAPGEVFFPERSIVLARASVNQMRRSVSTLNAIAELRKAKETAEFFEELPPAEQREWMNDLLARAEIPKLEDDVPYACLLDTGVNRGHPLIEPALAVSDLHAIEPAWGTDDQDGHGTGMAGLALVGNLTDALSTRNSVTVGHRLESVKLLPRDGANIGDSRLHGYLTTQAIGLAQIEAPKRRRVFGMAIAARDYRDRGRPSAWSAAIDRLAADADDQGAIPRLIVISAGNIEDADSWSRYPDSNALKGIHDPGQAWNALTVGACTSLVNIVESANYSPVASEGNLSPFSTTSATWEQFWPFKPDVVIEGGNVARDARGPVGAQSLSLLTTHHDPADRLFTTIAGTSASAALVVRMAAQIMAEYPSLWPETIRALIVHSAEWTEPMRSMFLPVRRAPAKSHYETLVRHCGFGVPDLARALWSASNSLTLIVEGKIRPFERRPGSSPTMRDMNLHELPWPLRQLEELGDEKVKMRVTLSYFIEPNPSERGTQSKFVYKSHGLHFEVKRSTESVDEFRSRINQAARNEEEGLPVQPEDPAWAIGKQARHRGSIHSDIWTGTAADLASRGTLAVFPVSGWWRTRQHLERYDSSARYSLIVSIEAPEAKVDLYNVVKAQIETPTMIET